MSEYNPDNPSDNVVIASRGVGSFSAHTVAGINSNSVTMEPLAAIQGQMITATLEVDEMQSLVLDDIAMKNKVMDMLVLELLSAKCIEFTKQQDHITNTLKVRARVFVTPDNQVRVIRNATK